MKMHRICLKLRGQKHGTLWDFQDGSVVLSSHYRRRRRSESAKMTFLYKKKSYFFSTASFSAASSTSPRWRFTFSSGTYS
ncbi:hypothetical protein DES53_101571 [Roseimicrobium gellanilyticum]|uniref:Uncharacterized protein n=1 Tax=Roseimicrobium gellanilyticum TaxID=748857 RepID=A0A366HU16_9BACT|nr:hypothetical protein DES53_101571 [Roseimicrobium gellanilyticum]